MKTTLTLLGIPLIAALAFAQEPAPSSQNPPGGAAPAAQTPSQPSAAAPGGAADTGKLPEMKTQNFSGTLMDASCAGSGAASTASTSTSSSSSSADRNAAAQPGSANAAGGQSGSANRGAAADSSCSVTASTSQFALKTKDGRVLRFDAVGNSRAQEALKNNKKWTANAGNGKPINAKASGVLNGDQLTVVTIH